MRNEELLKSLNALAEQAKNLEIETGKAIVNMTEQIETARKAKEAQICRFIEQMQEILFSVGYRSSQYVDILCCGHDWDGEPGACGSHQRNISLAIGSESAHFGRYFIGSACTDTVLCVNAARHELYVFNQDMRRKAQQLRELIIDRWTPETEQRIERKIMAVAKRHIEERMKKAADSLHAANTQYEKYFGKENQ